ncbi:DUF1684 domain-containing protein [Leeuwenhoekiella marinoflava]|uniref:DUF1684 domain-containing protein n=1 Tax=Leeuwenhoekiella marinoflava TaxID=988 RepID=UPI0030015EDE
MIKRFLSTLIVILGGTASAQTTYESEILDFQKDLNAEYVNPEESPLTPEEQKKFEGHQFYPIDSTYKVVAKFVKIKKPKTIKFTTSSGALKKYDTYAIAEFKLNGKHFKLPIYQSHTLRELEEYKDYLFVPFTDYTSGVETYGAGRYIDLRIPEGETIIIDFNKAYNPFCAYSPNYSCPIPPEDNDLKTEIKAGIYGPEGH